MGGAALGHNCRLVQVVLHRVQDRRHAFVGYHTALRSRPLPSRHSSLASTKYCPATCRGLRRSSCSLVTGGKKRREHTRGYLARRVVSRQTRGRTEQSGEKGLKTRKATEGPEDLCPGPQMRPASQQPSRLGISGHTFLSLLFFLGAALLRASLCILWQPQCVHFIPLCEFRRQAVE